MRMWDDSDHGDPLPKKKWYLGLYGPARMPYQAVMLYQPPDALLDYVFDSDSDWCMRQQLAPMFSGRGSAPVLHQSNSISFHKCC